MWTIDLLESAYKTGQLIFPGGTEMYSNPILFNCLIRSLLQKNWVVYTKKPFAGPAQVIEYLGRYTHKVAITNNRIISIDDGTVTFSYKDRQDNNQEKEMTLNALEFIRRFLLHVLPARFMKIRAYGFLANRAKKKKLQLCREDLNVEIEIAVTPKRSCQDIMYALTGKDITLCPKCQVGHMHAVQQMPRFKDRDPFLNSSNGSFNSSG